MPPPPPLLSGILHYFFFEPFPYSSHISLCGELVWRLENKNVVGMLFSSTVASFWDFEPLGGNRIRALLPNIAI